LITKENLVTQGLDQIAVGIGIFDSDRCLVYCNQQFRKLRGYPAELCIPGGSLERLLQYSAERGDFGPGDVDQQVRERLDEIQQSDQRRIEREMPSGQILSIRYQHLADDGLTISFEDKTEERKAQDALNLSEERYSLISEAAEEAIYEWDVVHDRFFASPRLKTFTGHQFRSSGKRDWRWEEYIHPDDIDRYNETLAKHRSGDLSRWQCEYRFRNAAGDYRWVSDHGTSVRDSQGEITRMVAAIRDITERIDREAALAASEERYQLITKASSDGIYEWDIVEDSLFVSDRLKEMFGFGAEALQSKRWASGVHPDDFDRYLSALRNHFKGHTDNLQCEYRITDADGHYRWVRDHGIGVRGSDGRVQRLVGAVRDITDIKDAEAKIDQANSRLLDSLENISDGFLLVDSEDRVQLYNRRYLEIFGNAAGSDISDIVFKGQDFFSMIQQGYRRGIFKPYPGGETAWIAERRAAQAKPAAELEFELSNGCWLLVNERQMEDGGRVSVYTDITEFKRRENQLEAARTRFADAIEALSTGFALFDPEDRMIVCNSKYTEYFPQLADLVRPGIAFDDLIRVGVERGLFPEAIDNRDAWIADLQRQRSTSGGIREQHMKGGLWLQISDHRTKEGGIVSIYTDVSELKKREEELRKQSTVLKATLENMDQGISMVDENLNVVSFNRKFLEYMQFPEKQFKLGFPMEQAFRFNAMRGEYGEGDVDKQVAERLELAAKFEPHRIERVRSDKTVLEIVGNPVAAGGFVTTYTDITQRKKSEDALMTHQAELRGALQEFNAVLDTIEYGVLFMGPDLTARIINRAFGDIWGISQAFIDTSPTMRELIEYNRFSGLYDVAEQDWDEWIDNRINEVQRGSIKPREVVRADGKVLQYQVIALPDGGRMLTYFDITELKRRETELITARDSAQQALRDLELAQERLVQSEKMASLGQLTAGIAHEIKNPLNFVNNFAKLSGELLEELVEVLETPLATLDPKFREDAEDLFSMLNGNLAKINQHGRRADSIVKNMLMHSRDGPSIAQCVSLNGLVEEALNLAYHGLRAENSDLNVELIRNFSRDVDRIECFPQDLMRVFLNLITNGMYAADQRKQLFKESSESFSPTLSVTTTTSGEHVAVEVRDNGFGIPDDIREKLFLPFFTTKPAGEGTGLGLSLSYDIVVKQHGGELSVESQPGLYAVFKVVLPNTLPKDAKIPEGKQ